MLKEFEDLALKLMNQHGLSHWKFKFDRAKKRAGLCSHHKKTISLSRNYVAVNSIEDIKDTILHEIAHALVGPGKGHGPIWKQKCVQIGAKPIRCYLTHIVMPKGKYQAICPNCGTTIHRHRAITGGHDHYHTKCGKAKGILKFRLIGETNAKSIV